MYFVSTNNNQTNIDAQTDYPHGYIYKHSNSSCCLHFPSHPLRCSYSSLCKKGFFWGGGFRMPPAIPPSIPPQPLQPSEKPFHAPPQPLPRSPVGQVTALHCEGLREPWRIPQMERGNCRQRPQLCGATKSPRVRGRNMGGKDRERESDGRQREGAREGEKEGERLREKREEKVVLV